MTLRRCSRCLKFQPVPPREFWSSPVGWLCPECRAPAPHPTPTPSPSRMTWGQLWLEMLAGLMRATAADERPVEADGERVVIIDQ